MNSARRSRDYCLIDSYASIQHLPGVRAPMIRWVGYSGRPYHPSTHKIFEREKILVKREQENDSAVLK